MQKITAVFVVFLIAFVVQSLIVIAYKNKTIRALPFVVFTALLVGLSVRYTHQFNIQPLSSSAWLAILIPLYIGCIVGWIVGLRLRGILVKEYRELRARYNEILERDDD